MTLWEQPELPFPGEVVRDGAGKVVAADGKVSTRRGRSSTWLACDVCGEGSWVAGLAPDQDRLGDADYRQAHGRPCRMTPRCPGRHLVSRGPG